MASNSTASCKTRLSRLLRALGVKDLGRRPKKPQTATARAISPFWAFSATPAPFSTSWNTCPARTASPWPGRRASLTSAHGLRRNGQTPGALHLRRYFLHLDTLHHAGLGAEKVVVCSIVDTILRGTSNKRLLQSLKRICPGAFIIVASDTLPGALELYTHGADFVLVPRLHSRQRRGRSHRRRPGRRGYGHKECQQAMLACRNEVLS